MFILKVQYKNNYHSFIQFKLIFCCILNTTITRKKQKKKKHKNRKHTFRLSEMFKRISNISRESGLKRNTNDTVTKQIKTYTHIHIHTYTLAANIYLCQNIFTAQTTWTYIFFIKVLEWSYCHYTMCWTSAAIYDVCFYSADLRSVLVV